MNVFKLGIAVLRGIGYYGTKGVSVHDLTMKQVQDPSYGKHTFEAMEALKKRGFSTNEAFNMVEGLNEVQARGVSEYFFFSKDDVLNLSFGEHILEAIDFLESEDFIYNPEYLKGINEDQVRETIKDILRDQARDQEQSKNFEEHTLNAIDNLKWSKGFTTDEAFNRVEGLDSVQVEGILTGLAREQVQSFNYGKHSLEGMYYYKSKGYSNQNSAFAEVEGLDRVQVIDKILKDDDISESIFPMHEKLILDTIDILHNTIPQAEDLYLRQTINLMKVDQLRGIHCGLTLDQVGIGIVDNKLVQQDPIKFNNLNLGNIVDAIENIRFQNSEITNQEAYDIAIRLSPFQLRGLNDFGLSLEQVHSQQYKDLEETVLEELIEKVQNKEGVDFSLSKEQKDIIRKELDKIIEKDNTKKSKEKLEGLKEVCSILNSRKSKANQKRRKTEFKVNKGNNSKRRP